MPSRLDSDSLSLDYDRELVLSAAKQCQAGVYILPNNYNKVQKMPTFSCLPQF